MDKLIALLQSIGAMQQNSSALRQAMVASFVIWESMTCVAPRVPLICKHLHESAWRECSKACEDLPSMARHFCSRCSCLLWLRCHSGRLWLTPLPTTKPLQSTSPLEPSGVSVSSSLLSAHHQADSKSVQLSSLGDSRSSQAAFAALPAHRSKFETKGIPNVL